MHSWNTRDAVCAVPFVASANDCETFCVGHCSSITIFGFFFFSFNFVVFFLFFEFSHFFLWAVILLLLLCVGGSAAALIAACTLQINIGEQRKRCSWLCALKTGRRRKKKKDTKQSNKTIKCSWVRQSHPNLETNATEDDRSFVHQRKNRLALSRLLLTLVYNPAAVWAVSSTRSSSTRGFLPGLPLFWVPRLCPIAT